MKELIYMKQHKQVKTMEMVLDLIFKMRDVYIHSNLDPTTKFSTSSRSTEFKDFFPWSISQMITKIVSMGIVISCVIKRGILF